MLMRPDALSALVELIPAECIGCREAFLWAMCYVLCIIWCLIHSLGQKH